METSNNPTNNNTNNDTPNQSTHEVTAAQLKRQRIRQLLVSIIGVAILVWGIVKIGCMFMDYKSNEKSDDAQVEQYISQPARFGIYQEDLFQGASECEEGRHPSGARRP